MAGYVAQIYTQAGLVQQGGYWVIPHMGQTEFSANLFKNTNLLALISGEENTVESLGFIRRNIVEYTQHIISVTYDSTIDNSHTARINIGATGTVITFTDGCFYSTLNGMLYLRQYRQVLAAEKERCAAIAAVIFECLPQPIAEEIIPEVCLSI